MTPPLLETKSNVLESLHTESDRVNGAGGVKGLKNKRRLKPTFVRAKATSGKQDQLAMYADHGCVR